MGMVDERVQRNPKEHRANVKKKTDFVALPDMQCKIVGTPNCSSVQLSCDRRSISEWSFDWEKPCTAAALKPGRRRPSGDDTAEANVTGGESSKRWLFRPFHTHHLLFCCLMLVRLRKRLRTHSVATSPSDAAWRQRDAHRRSPFITSRDLSKQNYSTDIYFYLAIILFCISCYFF